MARSNTMSLKEYKDMISGNKVTVGKKGRIIIADPTEEIPVSVPQDRMFNEADYLFIPGEVFSSKNSTQIRVKFVKRSKWKILSAGVWRFVTPFVSKSNVSKGYQTDKARIYKALAPDFKIMSEGQGFPLRVEFIFVRRTKARWDWINMLQVVQDCMVDAGMLPDDDVGHLLPCLPKSPNLSYYIDKTNPGVYIRVIK
jgi:Holliday junction resolvase RusA-like endonuclease